MKNQAIDKIKTEMDNNKTNEFVKVVGGFLLQHLEDNADSAEKILQADKTILKSLEEMKKLAKAKAVNGCRMFAPQDGFEIVLKYFGIKATAPVFIQEQAKVETVTEAQDKKANIDFNVELDF